jgi:hypothetical protein
VPDLDAIVRDVAHHLDRVYPGWIEWVDHEQFLDAWVNYIIERRGATILEA